MLGGLGALVVLAFVFASLLAFVPLLMAIVSIMATFLVLWGVTALTSVSMIVEFLVALIGLGVAIDYSLLVVVRWREERAHGRTDDDAVVRAMQTAGRAVVFSGTTVAIGLLAMVVLPLPFLRSIGYAGMLIPLVSVIVAITLLPIVLVNAGNRLDWPHMRTDDKASRAWTRWARLVVRRRWFAAGAAAVVLAALVLAATGLQPGQANVNTLSRKHGDARVGPARARALGDRIRRARSRSRSSPRPPRPSTWRARSPASPACTARWLPPALSGGARHRAASTRSPWPTARPRPAATRSPACATAAHGRGRRACASAAPARRTQDFVVAIYGSFPLMIALIAVLTFLLLARAFRSLLLPLKAVLLNVISVGAAWGVITLVWQQGHGSSALWGIAATHSVDAWIPLMVFAFLFGLSMDYEVFILARMREEYDAHRLHRRRGRARDRPHRPAGDERGADPVPGLRLDGLGARHRRQGVRHRAGRGDHPRRHRHPGAARARGGVAVRALELVAARAPGAAAAGRAVPAAARASRSHRGAEHAAQLQRRRVGPADPAVDQERRWR